ncbi:hypothetical protein BCEP27_40261 [Burkholderia cepacia]
MAISMAKGSGTGPRRRPVGWIGSGKRGLRSPSVGKIILRIPVNKIAESTAHTQKFLILSRFHAPS